MRIGFHVMPSSFIKKICYFHSKVNEIYFVLFSFLGYCRYCFSLFFLAKWDRKYEICFEFFIHLFLDGLTRLFGFLGSRVNLPCVGFVRSNYGRVAQLLWSKCAECGGQWHRIAQIDMISFGHNDPDDGPSVLGGRGTISRHSGDLIIHEVEKRDEGLYRCDPTGPVEAELQLLVKGHGLYRIRTWTNNRIHAFLWVVITHPHHYFK